jgi:hypothetical protein
MFKTVHAVTTGDKIALIAMAEQLKTYSIIEKQNKQTKRKKEKNSQ